MPSNVFSGFTDPDAKARYTIMLGGLKCLKHEAGPLEVGDWVTGFMHTIEFTGDWSVYSM